VAVLFARPEPGCQLLGTQENLIHWTRRRLVQCFALLTVESSHCRSNKSFRDYLVQELLVLAGKSFWRFGSERLSVKRVHDPPEAVIVSFPSAEKEALLLENLPHWASENSICAYLLTNL
jgi:hypothetical protein